MERAAAGQDGQRWQADDRAVGEQLLQHLHRELARLLALPEVKESFVRLGAEPRASTPDAFANQIKAEMSKWSALVKSMGLQLE